MHKDRFEIREAIAESGKTNIREIMQYLKARFGVDFDISQAHEDAKEMVKEMKGRR